LDFFENVVLRAIYGIVRKESKSEGRKKGEEGMRLEET